MRNSTCLPLRTAVFLLAVLLVLTPLSQVLAQATEQASHPTQTNDPDEISEPTAMPQDGQGQASLLNAPVSETDTVQLLRLGATSLFPKTDSSAAADPAAATTSAAAISTVEWVAIGVVVVVVGSWLFVIIYCASGC